MAEKVWYEFPIREIEISGQWSVLPTERDVKNAREEIAVWEDGLNDSKDPDEVKDGIRAMIEEARARADELEESLNQTFDGLKVTKYEVCEILFGEFLKAEENARDWIGNIPRIDDSKLTMNLMIGHIRLDGKTMSGKDISDLSNQVAKVLWQEVKARTYPNPRALSFLQARSR